MSKYLSRLKRYGRLVRALNGFSYDFMRYLRYSSWNGDLKDKNQRNYHSVKIYHALEKSLSFKNRKKDSGWDNAFLLLDLLNRAQETNDLGYHDYAGLATLKEFVNQHQTHPKAKIISEKLDKFDFTSKDLHGVMPFLKEDFDKGILNNPEDFFLSRYSLREFRDELVPDEVITRAVSMAMKSPSACNRQPWYVYHITDSEIKLEALKLQSGNKGFGDRIPNLMIITIDQNAFMPGQERYQHWIDGGLFSMSIIYALHSMGVASCCLNWSQTPKMDKQLHSKLSIQPNHSVIMMLAIGYPDFNNTVCISARRPIGEIITKLSKI